MTEIRAFRALRYSQQPGYSVGELLTPPYDVIGLRQGEELRQRSPYHAVHLESFFDEETSKKSGDGRSPYMRAAQSLEEWLSRGVLRQESEPALYLYRQSFRHDNLLLHRRAIIAALRAKSPAQGGALPHEGTMSAPKADRLALLQHTATYASPILALFPDPGGMVDELFDAAESLEPLFHTFDPAGQEHRLVSFQDPEILNRMQNHFLDSDVMIADGHHRYETAITLGEKAGPGYPGRSYLPAALVAIDDPGLLVLPTHRLLSRLTEDGVAALEGLLAKNYHRHALNLPTLPAGSSWTASLAEDLRGAGWCACSFRGRDFLLEPVTPPGSGDLSVSILHDRVLDPFMELFAGQGQPGGTLSFLADGASALASARREADRIAFLLPPPSVRQVYDRAARGLLMPRKSTFFHPKVPGGLLFYHTTLSY